ncbi:unnamed protein product [Rhizoctonia solani]|uniref:Uncharacterized protein n=1 Tax=Rhizoctonia solani TaxID=456999 RepID=A0A8H3H4Y7_9AGAM|nr:unnamed protein product [Rhizoctonia solani]
MDYCIRALANEFRKGRAHGDKVIALLQTLFRRNAIQKARSDAKAILFPQASEPLPSSDDTFLGDIYRISHLRDELLRGLSTTSGLSDFYVGQAKFHRSRKDPSNGFILFYIRDLKSNTESLLLLDQNNLRESFRDTDDSCPNDCYPSQVWLKSVEFLDSLAHPGRIYVHTGNKSKLEKMPESEWSIQSIQFDNPKTLEFAQLLALMKIVLSPFKGYLYRAAKQTLLWRLALMWQAMTDLNYMTAFSATQGMSLAGQISRQYAGLQVKSNFWRQVSYEVITLRADIINRQQVGNIP